MPIHDWTRVKPGTFHNFHYRWVAAIMDALNAGVLPAGYFAMAEQIVGGPEPDVITLQARSPTGGTRAGGVAVQQAAPTARFVERTESDRYARKANRVAIRHELGEVVAVIEVVSPGNKDSRHATRAFVVKAAELIDQGVNLLVVDLFPPTARDPQGIHKAVWDEFTDNTFELPPGKPLTMVSYEAGPTKTAYVEPVAAGDELPVMPLFLTPGWYVNVPLDATYQTTWGLLPAELKQLLEPAP